MHRFSFESVYKCIMHIHISRSVGYNAIFRFEMDGVLYLEIITFFPGMHWNNVNKNEGPYKRYLHPETLQRQNIWYEV